MSSSLKNYLLFIFIGILALGLINGLSWVILQLSFEYNDFEDILRGIANFTFGFFVFGLLGYTLFVLVRALVVRVHIFGTKPKSRLLALGIVFLIFSKSIVGLAIICARPIVESFEMILNREEYKSDENRYDIGYNDGYDDGYEDGYDAGLPEPNTSLSDDSGTTMVKRSHREKTTAQVFEDLANVTFRWEQNTVKLLSNTLRGIVQADSLKMTILAVVLGMFIGYLSDIYLFNQGEQSFKLFVTKYQNTLLYGSIFLVGGFLSISSIIALPELKKSNDRQDLSAADFEAQIEKYELPVAEIEKSRLEFSEVPYDALNKKLDQIAKSQQQTEMKTTQKRLLGLDINSYSPVSTSIQTDIERIKRRSIDAIGKAESAASDFQPHMTKLKKDLINDYDIHTKNYIAVGNEIRIYFRELLEYYSEYRDEHQRNLKDKNKRIQDMFDYNAVTLSDIEKDIEQDYSIRNKYYFEDPSSIDWRFESYLYQPRLGQSEGSKSFFRSLANWLIITGSDEMILIAGMLGFGFLGAGISSVIRNRGLGEGKQNMSGVDSVLIGGVSASLVVFLGAKGGFAILSDDDITLNPYTLLFLCLIGSVYSESVWERARKQLGAQDGPTKQKVPPKGGKKGKPEDKAG